MSRGLSRGLRSAFDGVIFDGDRASDALASVARSLVNTAYSAAIRPVSNHLGGLLAGAVSGLFADGGSFAQGRVMPFANGGVVSGPTAFPMRNGAGLDGRGRAGGDHAADAGCGRAFGRAGGRWRGVGSGGDEYLNPGCGEFSAVTVSDCGADGARFGARCAEQVRSEMSFHEVRFPSDLSFGSVGGPERKTEIVTLANGFEERNTAWASSRRRYDAGLGLRSLADVDSLIAFFEARRGQLFGFRWKDWSDFRSSGSLEEPAFDDQAIAVGDGETVAFQLLKIYRSGAETYAREIRKPVGGTVRVGLQGDVQAEGVDFEVDTASGVILFSEAPGAGGDGDGWF